jgi:hypothetical protein
VSAPYDWSRFRRRYLEPGAVVAPIDPEEEPTIKLEPGEMERLGRRIDAHGVPSAAELEDELEQHAAAGGFR